MCIVQSTLYKNGAIQAYVNWSFICSFIVMLLQAIFLVLPLSFSLALFHTICRLFVLFFDVVALQHVAVAAACECGMESNECRFVCACVRVYIRFDSFARAGGSFAGLLASLRRSYWGASIEDHCRINDSTAATAALSNIRIGTHTRAHTALNISDGQNAHTRALCAERQCGIWCASHLTFKRR